MNTLKAIYFFYSKPFFNKYYTHSRVKLLIWAVVIGLAFPFIFSSQFGNIFHHATLTTKIMVVIVECMLLSALRTMNEGLGQMYGDRNLIIFHSAGIAASNIILGQWLARIWSYIWSSIVITIPLTAGLPVSDKVTNGIVLFVVSLAVEMGFDLLYRYLLIVAMRYFPSLTKYFFGLSTLGFIGVFALLIYAITSLEIISAEAWQRFVQITTYVSLVCLALLLLLLYLQRKLNNMYSHSWLHFIENERTAAVKDSKISEFIRSAKEAILVKDLILTNKNIIMKVRIGMWVAGMIAGVALTKFHVLDSFVNESQTPTYLFAFVLGFTLLIFGEVISTLYQQEGQNYILYYAAAIPGKVIFSAKLNLAILLLVVPAVAGYIIAALLLQITGSRLLMDALWMVFFSSAAAIVQLGIAALDKKSRHGRNLSETNKDQNAIMEQVPRSPIPILSNLGGLAIGAFSLLLYWVQVHASIMLLILLPAIILYVMGVRASGLQGK